MAETTMTSSKEASDAAAPETTRGGIHYTPHVDIYENPEEMVLLCDMPGVKPSDIDVQFDKGQLCVSGKVAPRKMPAAYLSDEYGVGDFYRCFTIGFDVDAAKISAECRDGVLTIHLPKPEKAKPKRIAVKAS